MADAAPTGTFPLREPRLAFLADRSDAEWNRLVEFTVRERFVAGDVLTRAGDGDRSLLLLMEGAVAAEVPAAGAEALGVKRIEAPTVLGEIAFVDGGPRSLTLRAVEEGWLARLSVASFNTMAALEPAIAGAVLFDLCRIMGARLRMSGDVLVASLDHRAARAARRAAERRV